MVMVSLKALAGSLTPRDTRSIMSLYISNRLVRFFLKDELIMRVDPIKIHHRTNSSRPENRRVKQKLMRLESGNAFVKTVRRQALRATNALESFVIDPAYYHGPIPIEQHINYKKIRNVIEHRENYKESQWYLGLANSLEEQGHAKHKNIVMHSKDDIDHFMQSYVLTLLDSLEKDGFDFRKGGGIGRALIGEDGSIHKSSSGRHRFFAARELGIRPFPVRISGVHEAWYRSQIGSGFNLRKLKAALADIQAKHA